MVIVGRIEHCMIEETVVGRDGSIGTIPYVRNDQLTGLLTRQ